MSSADAEPTSYAAAADELDRILADLERDDVDVDQLADRVKRAGVLIAFCRARIANAQVQIETIVTGLE